MRRAVSLSLTALLWACATRPPPPPEEEAPEQVFRYLVLMEQRPAGVMSTTLRGERAHSFFTYQDRGRGPHLRLEVSLDEAGLPRSLTVSGEDEDDNPVRETFTATAEGARWQSDIDTGESAAGRRGFYIPVNAVPQTLAHLARALLKTPEHRLPLHPAGEARLTTLRTEHVSGTTGPLQVTLYAVEGLQFGPSLVWLAEDGSFFASGASWLAVIRREYQDALPQLLRAQAEALSKRGTLEVERPSAPVVVRGARVVDVRAGVARENWTVITREGWILEAGPEAEVRVPPGARVVEAAGRTLLPGLWDLHVHPEPLGELLHLAAGVIAIRDVGSAPREALGRRQAAQRREVLAPRLFLTGLIDGPGSLSAPTETRVETAAEARGAVERYAAAGFEGVKLYNSVAPELVPIISAQARARGLHLSGHVPAGMTAEEAVHAGVRELHHAYFLFPSVLAEPLRNHPDPQQVLLREAAWVELSDPRVERLVKALLERDVAVDATLALNESLYLGRRGAPAGAMAAVLDRLPPLVRRRVLATGVEAVPAETGRRMRRYHQAMLRLVAHLHRRGVRILAGSDGMAGFTLLRELELLQQAGLRPAEVLRLATLGAAEHLGRQAEWGTIERGKRADLLLVEGDPLADVSALRRAALVLFDGALLSPTALYGAASVRPLDVAPLPGR